MSYESEPKKHSDKVRSEWEVLDEIGRKLTDILLNCDCYKPSIKTISDNVLETKDLVNELKSSMIERNRK
jgi:hypothetical protein